MSYPPTDQPTQQFMAHRELLFSIIYGMLGSAADTEDVLQETWVSWDRRSRAAEKPPVEHPRSYLVRIAVNAALAQQDTIRGRRETYLGAWLPEPILTMDEESAGTVDSETVSLALLVVLETLSPLERTVFVLHELFGFPHTEVAQILDRTHQATRQLAHRAREHVRARRPRFPIDPGVHRELTERFVAAALGGDLGALVEMLDPDVTMTVDGQGARGAPRHPVHGRDKVVRLIAGFAGRPGDLDVHYRTVNNEPAAVVFAGESPFAVMVLDLAADGERIGAVYALLGQHKLSRVRRQ